MPNKAIPVGARCLWKGIGVNNFAAAELARAAGPDTMPDRVYQPETMAIPAGQIPDAATGARALLSYPTIRFVFDRAEHTASLLNLPTSDNVYSRLSNLTVAAPEERVAALEGWRAALACTSGMAAEEIALMTVLKAGDGG